MEAEYELILTSWSNVPSTYGTDECSTSVIQCHSGVHNQNSLSLPRKRAKINIPPEGKGA